MISAKINHIFYSFTTLLLTPMALAQDSGPSIALQNRVVIAHGICMGLVFAVFFPLGGSILHSLNFRGLIWFHSGWQLFSYAIALAGLGMGIWIAVTTDQLTASNGHPIIGIIVIGVLFLQPFGGLLHHMLFRKHQKPTVWGAAHRWMGRVMLILGAINGGLGLQLSADTVKGEIAYGVLAGIFFALWAVSLVLDKRQKAKSMESVEGSPAQEKRSYGSTNRLMGAPMA